MRNVLRLSFLCQLFVVANSLLMPPSSPPLSLNFSTLFLVFQVLHLSLPHSLARCQVMKQSIKNYVMNFFFEFLHHGRKQQEGFYKLILFNLNLFIAKNFFIMRLPPRRCFFHIVRNYNENFQKKKKINDLRDEGERNYSFMMMMVMGSAVKAFFSEPHTHTNHI